MRRQLRLRTCDCLRVLSPHVLHAFCDRPLTRSYACRRSFESSLPPWPRLSGRVACHFSRSAARPARLDFEHLVRLHFGGLDISFGIDPVLHLSLDVGVIALALVVFNVLLPHHAKQLLDFRLRYGTVGVRSNVELWSGSRSRGLLRNAVQQTKTRVASVRRKSSMTYHNTLSSS